MSLLLDNIKTVQSGNIGLTSKSPARNQALKGAESLRTCLVVSTEYREYRRVTDGQTDILR